MTTPVTINSASNKKIKYLAELLKKSRARREAGCFAAEGWHLYEEAPRERLRAVYVSASCYDGERARFDDLSCPCYVVEDALFDRVSDTKTPQGVISVVATADGTEDLTKRSDPLILVLDQISDPGNLGTMIRTGEAAGADALLLSPGCADPYQPKVVRGAMGALYRVPVITTADTAELTERLRELQAAGVRIYGTDLRANRPYDEPDLTKGTAFIIGNESHGVSGELLELCDERLIIPMSGQVESLNAAIAASVLLFEAARQRRG